MAAKKIKKIKEKAWPKCGVCKNDTVVYWRYKSAGYNRYETRCEPCGVMALLAGESFGSDACAWEPIKWWYMLAEGPEPKRGRDSNCRKKYGSLYGSH